MNGNTQYSLLTRTVTIDSDLSAKQYHFVSLDTSDDGVVNLLEAASAVPFVLTSTGDGSTTATEGLISLAGIVKLTLGGTVTAGAKLTATTGGVAIATTTDTDNYGAIALKSGVSGDVIEVLCVQGMIAA